MIACEPPSIVIVGAGVAGLAAAYRLARAGLDPLIVEAADRVGGRVHSLAISGYTLDLGAQLIYTDYRKTLDLCSELGLRKSIARFHPVVRIYRGGRLVSQIQVLDTWRKRIRVGQLYVRLRARHDYTVSRPDAHAPLQYVSFEKYAREHFGPDLCEQLFEPFTAGLVHHGPDKISAACGLTYVRCAFGGSRTLLGGMAALTSALAGAVRRRRLNALVNRVVIEGGRTTGITVARGDASEFLPADIVIVAIPAPEAASLIADAPRPLRNFLDGVAYSSSIHVFFALDQPLYRDIYAVIVPQSSGLQVACILEDAWKHPSLLPRGAGLAHVIIGGDSAIALMQNTDDELIGMVGRKLRSVVPSFPATYRFAVVHRWRRSVCLCGPGHLAAVAEFRRTSREIAGLYWAGDFMAVPSLEGAICSGLKSANDILRDLSLRPPRKRSAT
jgi:oxygen-dependent protoporphyrinogen oxidase